jgi:hypothetical protein
MLNDVTMLILNQNLSIRLQCGANSSSIHDRVVLTHDDSAWVCRDPAAKLRVDPLGCPVEKVVRLQWVARRVRRILLFNFLQNGGQISVGLNEPAIDRFLNRYRHIVSRISQRSADAAVLPDAPEVDGDEQGHSKWYGDAVQHVEAQ